MVPHAPRELALLFRNLIPLRFPWGILEWLYYATCCWNNRLGFLVPAPRAFLSNCQIPLRYLWGTPPVRNLGIPGIPQDTVGGVYSTGTLRILQPLGVEPGKRRICEPSLLLSVRMPCTKFVVQSQISGSSTCSTRTDSSLW